MFSVQALPIDLTGFYKNYGRFKKELEIETRIALVNTRRDFLRRVISIVGSVPAEGGSVPSPYVAYYSPLSSVWIEIKRTKSYMRNIGTATGDLLNWLVGFMDNPAEVAKREGFQSIDINLNTAPEEIRNKVWMMESGKVSWTDPATGKRHPIPARPIFHPVVEYIKKEGLGMSPFYMEMIKARDRAIERVYGGN